jgi:outer membrane autotransporter protein
MNTITGDLSLGGLLDLTDDAPDDQTDVTGMLDGQGGTIALDVTFSPMGPVASDLVTFGGNLTGTAWVQVNPVASMAAPADPDLIQFGGSPLADIDLVGGYLPVDGLVYGLERDSDSYFLFMDGTVSEEVAGAMALSAALPALNRDLFGDLGARIGTGDALRRPGLADGGSAIWARIGGTHHEGDVGEDGVDVDLDMDHFYAQVGADLFRADTGDGAIVGAVMAQYGTASADVDQPSLGPSTDVDVDSYGFGLGATWYPGDGETYVDLTGMLNWHDIDVASEGTDAMSYTVGLEAGTRIPAGAGFAIAPMGQLVYSHANVDKIDLPSALNGPGKLKLDDPESLEARALAMLELDVGQSGSVQFGGGFAYEFLGDSDVDFGPGYQVETDTSGASGELAARAQFSLSEGVTAFGDVRGRWGLSGDALDSYGGLLGIKVDF